MSDDVKPANGKMPSWASWVLGMLATIVTGAIGYGELKSDVSLCLQQQKSIERRIEQIEKRSDEREKDIYKAINDVRNALGTVQIDLAKVCARLKC